MSQRFFVENSIEGNSARLEGAEAHHFLHVMRGKVGSEIVLFDGSNQEFTAQVTATTRSTVDLEVLKSRTVDRESAREVTLGVALPKGDRARWLVEKLTELGVRRLVPLRTERGVAQPVDGALAKMRRAVIEASKAMWTESINGNRLADGLASPSSRRRVTPTKWLDSSPHPEDAGSVNAVSQAAPLAGVGSLLFAVGPEGGLTEEEVSLAKSQGWKTISLGLRILRIETAAVALATWSTLE